MILVPLIELCVAKPVPSGEGAEVLQIPSDRHSVKILVKMTQKFGRKRGF